MAYCPLTDEDRELSLRLPAQYCLADSNDYYVMLSSMRNYRQVNTLAIDVEALKILAEDDPDLLDELEDKDYLLWLWLSDPRS